jgi:hypothetical protein
MASPPSSPEISAALGGEEQYYSFSYKDATEEEIMEELTTSVPFSVSFLDRVADRLPAVSSSTCRMTSSHRYNESVFK